MKVFAWTLAVFILGNFASLQAQIFTITATGTLTPDAYSSNRSSNGAPPDSLDSATLVTLTYQFNASDFRQTASGQINDILPVGTATLSFDNYSVSSAALDTQLNLFGNTFISFAVEDVQFNGPYMDTVSFGLNSYGNGNIAVDPTLAGMAAAVSQGDLFSSQEINFQFSRNSTPGQFTEFTIPASSISVVEAPEPSATHMLGLGGLSLMGVWARFRRGTARKL